MLCDTSCARRSCTAGEGVGKPRIVSLRIAKSWSSIIVNTERSRAAVISDRLGRRISEGKIACMIAPPTNSHLGRHARDCDTWVEYQHMQSLLEPHEIVEDCEGMYEDAYGNVAKRERDGLVLSDLQQDLVKMSNQPTIRYVYRRFVIIKSNTDVHGRSGEEDWVSSQSGGLHFRAVNLLVTPSANGNWFQGSRLATKLIASINRGST
jgi:hypothetical protein